MNSPDNPARRRMLLRSGLGAAALTGAAPLFAAVTPGQTEGPFFPVRDQSDKDLDLTQVKGRSERASGEPVELSGQVLDEDGKPVADALVDVWQANAHGRYAHERDPNPAPLDPNFQGWARFTTDAEGRFRILTIKPGAYPVQDDWSRPPHLHFKVARRGFHELVTQMYFAGEPLNDVDRLLQAVPATERASLLVAFGAGSAETPPQGHFSMVLRRA
jgi:protocatechuate 3,4-dioxygenase beta subunit